MHILSITATKNRHHCLERVLGMLLNQNTDDKYTILIYNNSKDEQVLGEFSSKDNIQVKYIHQYIDSYTGEQYKTLGAIYNDILQYIPDDVDVITHADDDDMFLPSHISRGVEGYKKALSLGKLAYKPSKSYYRHQGGITLLSNTLEPSIFINYKYLLSKGYSNTTSDQHLQWVKPLVAENKLFVDENGAPTLVYNWGHDYPTFKTSGDPTNLLNFFNYEKFSQDKGDGIITPLSKEYLNEYYKEIENAKLP